MPLFNLTDDKGNIINLPPRINTQSGIYRTVVEGNAPKEVLHSVKNKNLDGTPGFTPQEAYFIKGTASIDPNTGYPVEMGNYPDVATPNGYAQNFQQGQNLSRSNMTDNNFELTMPFVDKSAYITNNTINPNTGVSVGYGNSPTNVNTSYNSNVSNLILISTNQKNVNNTNVAKNYDKTSKAQRDFIHQMDRIIPDDPTSGVHLASFVKTNDDNEDPTVFGYDLIVKIDSSPLFNGAIPNFIDLSNDPDLKQRLDIWRNFCGDFFTFFHSRLAASQSYTATFTNNNNGNSSTSKLDSTKPYYLKKITGLDKLVEKETWGVNDSVKTLVDYGKDVITLGLNEDVRMSTGTLAMLYKTLHWNRTKGKSMFPENLLRFDIDIEITEIRDYERVVKDFQSGNYLALADVPPKYVYSLYDCQFEFKELSHGAELNMSDSPKFADEFDITFNYKFSTLKLKRFLYKEDSYFVRTIDNNGREALLYNTKSSKGNLYATYSASPFVSGTSSTLNSLKRNYAIKQYSQLNINPPTSPSANVKNQSLFKKVFNDLTNNIKKAVVTQINTDVTRQFRLLNDTLNNIRNSNGIGRMSAPTNVYDNDFGSYQNFKNDIQNAFRDFVGQSIKGFFTR